jgi:hypothetical protein
LGKCKRINAVLLFLILIFFSTLSHAVLIRPRTSICTKNLSHLVFTPIFKIAICSDREIPFDVAQEIEAELIYFTSCANKIRPECDLTTQDVAFLKRVCIHSLPGGDVKDIRTECGCGGPAAGCYMGGVTTDNDFQPLSDIPRTIVITFYQPNTASFYQLLDHEYEHAMADFTGDGTNANGCGGRFDVFTGEHLGADDFQACQFREEWIRSLF